MSTSSTIEMATKILLTNNTIITTDNNNNKTQKIHLPITATYRIGAPIGEGGNATVFEGTRIADGFSVAIKIVKPEDVTAWTTTTTPTTTPSDDEKPKKLIPLEIAILRQLSHIPGVIRLYDWYEHPYDGSFWIVMERPACGVDLFDFITERRTLPERLCHAIFRQLYATIVACRDAADVYHLDIKDENIVFDRRTKRIKLIDFGAAEYVTRTVKNDNFSGPDFGSAARPRITRFNGTRVYSPPEAIYRGSFDAELATVWSLGILLFNMVTGNVPFEADHEIIGSPLPPFDCDRTSSAISDDCRDLIEKCLRRNEMTRITLDDIGSHRWMASCGSCSDCCGDNDFDSTYLVIRSSSRQQKSQLHSHNNNNFRHCCSYCHHSMSSTGGDTHDEEDEDEDDEDEHKDENIDSIKLFATPPSNSISSNCEIC